MNAAGRKFIQRLTEAGKVPGAHLSGGSQTASMAGMGAFARDAEVALEATRRILMAWRTGDDWWPWDAEPELRRLELWQARRRTEGWSNEGSRRGLDSLPADTDKGPE